MERALVYFLPEICRAAFFVSWPAERTKKKTFLQKISTQRFYFPETIVRQEWKLTKQRSTRTFSWWRKGLRTPLRFTECHMCSEQQTCSWEFCGLSSVWLFQVRPKSFLCMTRRNLVILFFSENFLSKPARIASMWKALILFLNLRFKPRGNRTPISPLQCTVLSERVGSRCGPRPSWATFKSQK